MTSSEIEVLLADIAVQLCQKHHWFSDWILHCMPEHDD